MWEHKSKCLDIKLELKPRACEKHLTHMAPSFIHISNTWINHINEAHIQDIRNIHKNARITKYDQWIF